MSSLKQHPKISVTPTSIADVLIIEPKVFGDERGWFTESFNAQDFSGAVGLDVNFVQDNHSFSRQSTLRGMHYQLEKAQGKLVRVVSGSVYDVAVDLRKNSPTYGKWMGLELSAENHKQLWIPAGLAHGFLVLTPMAEFLYKTTDYYHPQSEICLAWDDPTVAIEWPKSPSFTPNLNPKDLAGLSWEQVPKF
ncbi:dTDP-4-dehydrorhamnose 3,5-epimerase [Polynucleobacter sp. AP-Sanab-80-C2]|uniref:dTDP-4-dehydrorhamnose 3,5-epimerase n=1 Tax=Polynucleobacter sp. AP-Sanab-80-C2 TaxID=3108274 RepID=UPI002B2359E4|nr:dTDP-4-dehydrorhamnose 3,5-epimerase [Polynucleobacter sp. AP-Sanab-80-C2]MEA9598626.1 dTDP-4-dehydrorhamnose 3,5-epimerase [Polynucleobacter sp. AP-Sanab-80-C2]